MTNQTHSGPDGPWSGSDEGTSEDGDHAFADSKAESSLSETDSEPNRAEAGADDLAPSPGAADSGSAGSSSPARRRGRRRSRRKTSGSRELDGREMDGGEERAGTAAALDPDEPDGDFAADDGDSAESGSNSERSEAGPTRGADGELRPRRRRSRGGRGRRRRGTSAAGETDVEGDEDAARSDGAADAPDFDDFDDQPVQRGADADRADDRDEDGDEDRDEDGGEDGGEERNGELESAASKKRRRRGSRGGRRRKKVATEGREPARAPRSASRSAPRAAERDDDALDVEFIPGEDDDLDSASGREEGEDSRRRSPAPTRHSRSGKVRKKSVDVSDGPSRRKSTRKRASDDASMEPRTKEVVRDQLILVNAVDPEETRVVVHQGDHIVDLVMTVNQHKTYVNDIYRGRVVNIEEAIGAAFVDFGQGRNGFLHASDVMHIYGDEDWRLDKLLTARTDAEEWQDDARAPTDSIEEGEVQKPKAASSKRPSRRKRLTVSELLKRGQLVVAQITKDAIGDKGPTLTTYISIPGRYLVLMPSLEKTGVSRKIEDDRERRRLKRILQTLDIPPGMGVIVRTAGVGKTKEEIRRDLDYLLAVWEGFSRQLVLGRNPAPLYQESSVSIRTMRDLFSSRTKAVIVDDQSVYDEMREFTEKLMPEHLDRIELHDGDRPLFHTYSVEQDFEKLFARRVELPSGGSIVFDQTEALVAIDVNSGRTRNEGSDFEDIALKANLEAVPEIARQIKLRDLGGIIVVDFIDMMRPASRRLVEKAFKTQLDEDRARSKVGRISQFGLLELTRQRLGPGLSKLLYESCNYCRGTGRRRTAQSKAQAVLRRLASALTQKGFTKIEILVHPDTLEWLQKHDWKEVRDLEAKSKRELSFLAAEDQHEDSVFHYLRADGREVRPGGRRRR